MSRQVGQFFLFIGLIGLAVFYATDQNRNPVWGFFCGGFVLFWLGVYLIWRGRTPPPPSARFSMIRKYREKQALKKQKEKDEERK